MNREEIIEQIRSKQSFLCIGLDTDLNKVPQHLLSLEEPIFEFNKAIIDATHHVCIAYKPNLAFYEAEGISGVIAFDKTVKYIKEKYPKIFVIADAKRGDIGNTSTMYAQAYFEKFGVDAITVAPYMGADSIKPFLQYEDKWTILLALTSNDGAKDFQWYGQQMGGGGMLESNPPLYKSVIQTSKSWGTEDNMMYVVGATQAYYLGEVRKIIPNHFLLIPGVGAQGGSLEDVCKYGLNNDCSLLVNSSRAIIYASDKEDFAEIAREEAQKAQEEMSSILKNRNIIQ